MTPEQLAYLEMYKEHAQQARQHETQRERMTGAVVAIGVALIAFVSTNLKEPTPSLFLPAFLVVILGCYGTLFSRKHYERNRLHTDIMAAFRNALENSLANAPLGSIRAGAESAHNNTFQRLHRWRLHLFWDGLNAFVAFAGAILVAVLAWALLKCGV